MPKKIVDSKPITVSEVKKILENIGRELNQFQRKTLDYSSTFSKIKSEEAGKLVEKLSEEAKIDLSEAVQIVNCMPESVEELRAFLPRHKVFETAKINKIMELLDEYRK